MLPPAAAPPKDREPLVLPPPLVDGDLIAVVAPSSPFPREKLERGVAWLSSRFRVRLADGIFERRGYLAGDDDRRREQLALAFADREVAAIVAARGGYGATRILDDVDFSPLVSRPKWIVGFSDVTALHLALHEHGVASMHASMLAALGDADEESRAEWIAALTSNAGASWRGLVPPVAGEAEGGVFGGNLAMLYDAAARGRLCVPEGAILLIEDCTEKPYRVDRMLTALERGGHLARVSAVVVGDFTDCTPGKDEVTVEQVLTERLSKLGKPVSMRAPFGHGARNRPWRYGQAARLREQGTTLDMRAY